MQQSNDLSLVGQYLVTVVGTLSFHEDYTLTNKATLTAQFTFTIFVEPCKVDSFVGEPLIDFISYSVGSATLTAGDYGFTQTPPCGYAQTITVSGLPSFVDHREADKNFQI